MDQVGTKEGNMFTKLVKVLGFFKSHATTISVLATIILAIGAGIQGHRANKWEAEVARLDGKLEEQQADQDKLYGEAAKARATRNVERAEEAAERARLEASIKKARAEGLVAKRALAAEKKKTATLPPTELVKEVAARIGDELTLTGDRLYLFTRTGTERTLNRFKDGEFHLGEYAKYQKVLKDHAIEIASFNESITSCELAVVENLVGWNDCRETLATAQADIIAIKKTKKGGVWRGRKQGAIVVGIIVGGLKLFGVW
jgi:hypothetical protein